ncbi:hypothetical protein IFU39_16540 [Paenibacillus sp. CFBP 13594]|uniref:hypothetical protein n=1 Tax=Paenibacillus sp. CFBP 13594 TaxID=2774037 RepID=UPI001786BD90|nr:hypothetical protein [Paenibacillus sp. CFBP 13594]MBD8839422.1 hypothetical protein [Paenibacillus sp. CFBP 13594]
MLMLTGAWTLVAIVIALIGMIISLKKKKYFGVGGYALCITVLAYILLSSPEPFSIY